MPISTAAQDYVTSSGLLSDEAFYLLVACGATPGGPCQNQLVRWPPERARDLRIAFAPLDQAYPPELRQQIFHGLSLAIETINHLGAGLEMRQVGKGIDADVIIHLLPISSGGG